MSFYWNEMKHFRISNLRSMDISCIKGTETKIVVEVFFILMKIFLAKQCILKKFPMTPKYFLLDFPPNRENDSPLTSVQCHQKMISISLNICRLSWTNKHACMIKLCWWEISTSLMRTRNLKFSWAHLICNT